ncbi:MAG: hypothetical protein WCO52_00685 [bacterium]
MSIKPSHSSAPSFVAEKVVELDVRVRGTEQELIRHDRIFESINKRFDAIERRLDALEDRMQRLEDKVDKILDFLVEKDRNDEKRFRMIEEKLSILSTILMGPSAS